MLRFTSLSVKQIKTPHFSHVHLPFGIQMKHTIPYSESTAILKNNLISLDVQVKKPHLEKFLTGNYGISELKIAFEFINYNFVIAEMKALVIGKLGGLFKLI